VTDVDSERVNALLAKLGPQRNGAKPVPAEIPEGERDGTLASVAGKLRRIGLTAEEMKPTLQAVNDGRCAPPLPEKQVDKIANSIGKKPAGDLGKKRSTADVLLEIASTADLYHGPDGTGFADVIVAGHRETWPVADRGFKSWLKHAYFVKTGGAPTSEAMQSAVGVIEARCQFEGRTEQTHLRVAAHDGRHYIDLADADWRAIEVDATGWRIVAQPPVRFRRTPGMKPLPEPVPGASIEALRPFLNVSDGGFELCVAWLLATLRGEGQRPVLALHGEQGSAKSTTASMLRRLTDPSTAPLRALPRTLWDLNVAAMNAHVLVFDNLSGLPADVSDALCRLSTGGGFSARKLYSDDSEVLFSGTRAVILTGIDDLATRPDLIDRALMPSLDSIPEDRRRTDAELWAAFDATAPGILGALLSVMSFGTLGLPHTKIDKMPRMADFALWMAACEQIVWPAGTFARAYAWDAAGAMTKALDAEPAIVALRKFLQEQRSYDGTADGLLTLLGIQVGPNAQRGRSWPTTPRAPSALLNRYATALRAAGVVIERSRDGAVRQLRVAWDSDAKRK
jgi:hypothetical protein